MCAVWVLLLPRAAFEGEEGEEDAMSWCNCHYCRTYSSGDCSEREHLDTFPAKHLEGAYYWGEHLDEANGRWVRICQPCADALSENADDDPKWIEAFGVKE